MKIPFSMLPASWGLKGRSREQARIEYELDGYEREVALAQLNADYLKLIAIQLQHKVITKYEHDNLEAEYRFTGDELALRKLEIELEANNITDLDFELKAAAIKYNGDELIAKNLEIDYKFGKLTSSQYEKALATHKEEPWVNLAEFDFKKLTDKSGLSVELEYNEFFITYLKENGYYSKDEDEMVHQWFVSLCRQIATEEETFDELDVTVIDLDKK